MKLVCIALATVGVALVVGPLLVEPTGATPSSPPLSEWNLVHVCTYCHDPHGGPENANLKAGDIEVLCLTCHGPGGVSTLKAAVHDEGPGFTCMDCHDHHKHADNWLGGQNLKMVGWRDPLTGLASIQTENSVREVVFESLGTQAGGPALHSFADGDLDGNGIYDGACEVCHISGNDAGAPTYSESNHNQGQTCTVCHLHATGFQHP